MATTPFLQIVRQRHDADCGVACLAMLLGVNYETALLALGSLKPLEGGVMIKDIKTAAKRLGRKLRFTRGVDLENDTGILSVRSAQWKADHVVILKEGLIVDTDATLWEAQVYLDVYGAEVLSLLVLDDEKT